MNRLKTAEGIGILWTTHLVDEIERADRFIVLRRGHVTFMGTRAELMASAPDGDLGAAVIRLMDAGEPEPTPPLPREGG